MITEPAKKKYDVAITVKMPGQIKENTYHIVVEAYSPVDATSTGISEWKKTTEPANIHVREVVGVIVA